MAEDWEKLSEDWKDDPVGFIGEVDCTEEGNAALCGDVQGFPTLKYGDPDALEDYQGGRDYDEMAAFAKENLKPMCSLKSIDLCDDETKVLYEKYQKMSTEELEEIVSDVEAKLLQMVIVLFRLSCILKIFFANVSICAFYCL